MVALLRILLVNTVWRLLQARTERIEDAQIRARVAASLPPLPTVPPPARQRCPDCGQDLPANARFCTGCLKAF